MTITLVVTATLLGLAAAGSGLAKITKQPALIENLSHVGVREQQVPLLGVLEVAGAIGLLVGIWARPLGIAASIGLACYFLGAVIAHLRKGQGMKETAPALVLFALAVVVVVLELKR
ncbi:MAG: DoxX family protein [Actinomycetota bacterium]